MARFFNGQSIELLAPAGNFSIFNEIIKLPCDAVYIGGKKLNMRLHRKDFNFTDAELKESVQITHSLRKKIYITVNNLHSKDDLLALPEYLAFLEELKPDALIIQDMSILQTVKRMGLSLPLHASVMANVHNLETIKRLRKLDITRVVMSREIPLNEIKAMKDKTDMEFEYFVHGDMCIAHGGQCLYSSFVFGQSGNRGLCMKPCRWAFDMKKDGKRYSSSFPLAVKDMCMYEFLPELIESGVTSFKIEGRMREFSYLKTLINAYGDAINRFISEPFLFDRSKDIDVILQNRNRDLSTAYAFGKPGLKNINSRYEGTGKFYSTGKVFSTATEERNITQNSIDEMKEYLQVHKLPINQNSPNSGISLSVKVNNFSQARVCIEKGVQCVYISTDTFLPDNLFSLDEIEQLNRIKGSTKILIALPHMMNDFDFEKVLSSKALALADGILCTNIGAISAFNNFANAHPLMGDYSLNIYNTQAAEFYINEGIKKFTLSTEMPASDVVAVLEKYSAEAEMIVHGSPTVMYIEHDLFENINEKNYMSDEDNKHEASETLVLVDEKGYEHPVYKDCRGRNHVLSAKDLCLLPLLNNLYLCGLRNMRIEACHINSTALGEIISIYQSAIGDLKNCKQYYNELEKRGDLIRAGLTFGAFDR